MRTKTLERKLNELGYIKRDAVLEQIDKDFGKLDQSTRSTKRSLSDEIMALKEHLNDCDNKIENLPQLSEYEEVKDKMTEILEGVAKIVEYLQEVKTEHKECQDLKSFEDETRKELSLIRKTLTAREKIVNDKLEDFELRMRTSEKNAFDAFDVSKKYKKDCAKYLQDAKTALNENLDKINAFTETYNSMISVQKKKHGRVNTQKWSNTPKFAESS